jgi:hypothetical protein
VRLEGLGKVKKFIHLNYEQWSRDKSGSDTGVERFSNWEEA